jgi:hypothetical protein
MRFRLSARNIWNRRNLADACSDDGPFTIRFADLHDRAMRTSGLLSWRSPPWKPPEGKLDGGESKRSRASSASSSSEAAPRGRAAGRAPRPANEMLYESLLS